MLFKDEQTGIQIEAIVGKIKQEAVLKRLKSSLGKDGKIQLTRTKGKKTIVITRAQVKFSVIGDTDHAIVSAEAKQNPIDNYSQLKGKRLVFSKILNKIRENNYDIHSDITYNTKKLRTAIWRIGEVFAGVRDKSTVFIDLPS